MKKALLVLAVAAGLLMSLSLALGACARDEGTIVGTWVDEAGGMQFQFRTDGTLVVEYLGGRFIAAYAAEDGRLSVQAVGPQGATLRAMLQDIE